MYIYRIPWGGSLAVRTSALRKAGLVDAWGRCLCEDTSTYGPIRALGLRLAFAPAATQVNSESTDLAGCYYFMLRQIVCVRLHHVFWWRLFTITAATIISFVACCLLASIGIVGAVLSLFGVTTELWKLAAMAIFPALCGAGVVGMVAGGDRLVRRVVAAPPRVVGFPNLFWATSLALYQATYAIFAAPMIRSIDWRGITYDIEGRGRIRMRAFRPYRVPAGEPGATCSVL
jgi:hypothetical protein